MPKNEYKEEMSIVLMVNEQQKEKKKLVVSEACRQDITKCTLGELGYLVQEKSRSDSSFDDIGQEAREEVESTLFANIGFAIALVIGFQISLLFELFVIPLIPVGGFWGIIITILLFIGILVAFTYIKILYKRRTKNRG